MDDWLQSLDPDPELQFAAWLAEARVAVAANHDAAALATVSDAGQPSVRMVLVRGHDARGFVFFTNRESRKATELEGAERAALCFYWQPLERQIRIEGPVGHIDDAESDAYFATRPRDSQLGAWASPQSRPITGREGLEDALTSVEALHAGADVPRPPYWGGYRVRAEAIEFWQGRPGRLHDRVRYDRLPEGTWARTRLAP